MPEQNNDPIRRAAEIAALDREKQVRGERQGRPSVYTCPECGGTLWQVEETEILQFRCHVGHILTSELLLQAQGDAAENSLWYTIRTLMDQVVLSRELALYARKKGAESEATRFEAGSDAALQRAEALRRIAEDHSATVSADRP